MKKDIQAAQNPPHPFQTGLTPRMNENENVDALITEQTERIQADIASSTALVSDRLPLTTLEEDFASDEVFRSKVAKIKDKYAEFRRTRPDGNCFFRAIGFRLFELLLGNSEEFARVKAQLEGSKDQMVALGMPEFTVEDFYDNFMETLGTLGGEEKISGTDLDTTFNDEGVSNYLVVFLRYDTLFDIK